MQTQQQFTGKKTDCPWYAENREKNEERFESRLCLRQLV